MFLSRNIYALCSCYIILSLNLRKPLRHQIYYSNSESIYSGLSFTLTVGAITITLNHQFTVSPGRIISTSPCTDTSLSPQAYITCPAVSSTTTQLSFIINHTPPHIMHLVIPYLQTLDDICRVDDKGIKIFRIER